MSERSARGRATDGIRHFLTQIPLAGASGFLRLVTPRRRAAYLHESARFAQLGYRDSSLAIRVSCAAEHKRSQNWRKEPETLAWLEEMVKPGDTFYDIGANVGCYSLIAHFLAKGRLSVCAFEPNPPTFAALCANLSHNGVSATALGIALSDSRSTLTLNGSLLEPGPTSRTDLDGGFTVLCERLDDLVAERGLPVPTIVKIDVDGAEEGVLRGAASTLARPEVRSILIELDQLEGADEPPLRILGELGWQPRSRHDRGSSKRYCNVILERPGYEAKAASSASMASSSLGASST